MALPYAHSAANSASNEVESRPLKIAGVDPELRFGGGETQVLALTVGLLNRGHRAELICDPAGILWQRARGAGIVCHALRIRNSVDIAAGMHLRTILFREHYDVVHFHTARAHSMAPFARRSARASIVTRRMDYRPNRIFASFLFGRAVDGVAGISHGVADALAAAGVPRDKTTIIASGVDSEYFRPPTNLERRQAREALGLSSGTIAIGAMGALEPRKGHRVLIDAIAKLKSRGQSRAIKCFIAGDGSLRSEIAAELARAGLSDDVVLLGKIDDPRATLWALDMFAFPSIREGLGIAMLEAMACGLAVVAANSGGIGDAIEDRVSGMLVPAGDSNAMCDAIVALLANPEIRTTLGGAARDRVRAEFSIDVMTERTLELYRACIAAKSGGGRN